MFSCLLFILIYIHTCGCKQTNISVSTGIVYLYMFKGVRAFYVIFKNCRLDFKETLLV